MVLSITPQVFSILNSLVEDRFGIHYDAKDAALFAEKISPRAQELGFDSLLDYYYFLRYDPGGDAELDELVERLVVHETYFFRELPQLRALIAEVLAPAIARGQRPRVWCAACSTGEEPLTFAMLLAEAGLFSSVEIVAISAHGRSSARAPAASAAVRCAPCRRATSGGCASTATPRRSTAR
jgi:chemotaxis protein methyltransferase CheR